MSELDNNKRAQAIGWFLSCAFHGTLIIFSFFFVNQVRLAPQPEPFQWNVAIVSNEQAFDPEKVVPVPQGEPPQPLDAKPMPRPPTKAVSAPKLSQPKSLKVVPPPPPSPSIVQEAALPPAPTTTVLPPQPLTLPETPPAPTPPPQISMPEPATEPLPVEQAKLPEPKLASPPPPLAEVAKPDPKPPIPTPPIEQPRIPEPAAIQPPPQTVNQADLPSTHPKLAESRPPVQEKVQEPVVQKALQANQPVQAVQPIPTPQVEAPPKLAQQPTRPSVQKSQSTNETSHAAPVPPVPSSKPETQLASTNTESPSAPATTRVTPQPLQEQVALLNPPQAPVRSKPDYRWLSELIVKRVEELKRYPAEARLEQAEGRVVVKVVILEDGTVSDTEIVKSSGFHTLDEAALELMRQSGPFTFPHPLGKPSLTIKVPINYALERP